MALSYSHTTVLVDEVISFLRPTPGQRFVDATIGGGGHAKALLERSGPDGKVLGFDLDPRAIAAARAALKIYGSRVTIVRASYTDIDSVLLQYSDMMMLDGIIIDLGLSSDQLDASKRGFSFRDEGRIDMRFDPDQAISASDLLNTVSEQELWKILEKYGEVRYAGRIAKAIIKLREQEKSHSRDITVPMLVGAITEVLPQSSKGIHPATQVFQALRIAVNRELDRLTDFLPSAIRYLRPGGRIAVISFHSLEDRIVKEYFKKESRDCLCPPSLPICRCDHHAQLTILTDRPITPSAAEIQRNPRSRSARLRVAERLVGKS